MNTNRTKTATAERIKPTDTGTDPITRFSPSFCSSPFPLAKEQHPPPPFGVKSHSYTLVRAGGEATAALLLLSLAAAKLSLFNVDRLQTSSVSQLGLQQEKYFLRPPTNQPTNPSTRTVRKKPQVGDTHTRYNNNTARNPRPWLAPRARDQRKISPRVSLRRGVREGPSFPPMNCYKAARTSKKQKSTVPKHHHTNS